MKKRQAVLNHHLLENLFEYGDKWIAICQGFEIHIEKDLIGGRHPTDARPADYEAGTIATAVKERDGEPFAKLLYLSCFPDTMEGGFMHWVNNEPVPNQRRNARLHTALSEFHTHAWKESVRRNAPARRRKAKEQEQRYEAYDRAQLLPESRLAEFLMKYWTSKTLQRLADRLMVDRVVAQKTIRHLGLPDANAGDVAKRAGLEARGLWAKICPPPAVAG